MAINLGGKKDYDEQLSQNSAILPNIYAGFLVFYSSLHKKNRELSEMYRKL